MAFRCLKRKRLIDDLPTSKAHGVFIGLTELKGTAESEAPLTSYLAGMRCVWYAWDVKEHWSRTVTETYTDSHGRTQIRTRRESGWEVVARGGEAGVRPAEAAFDAAAFIEALNERGLSIAQTREP